MHCVHAADGSIHVIDGQNSKVYDLSHDAERKAFDDKFGNNGGLCVARFFTTGPAPRTTAGDDLGLAPRGLNQRSRNASFDLIIGRSRKLSTERSPMRTSAEPVMPGNRGSVLPFSCSRLLSTRSITR